MKAMNQLLSQWLKRGNQEEKEMSKLQTPAGNLGEKEMLKLQTQHLMMSIRSIPLLKDQ